MQPWVTTLDERARAECVRFQDDTLGTVVRRGRNYTGLHHPSRFFDGRAGELAFVKWFQEHGLAYVETVNKKRRADRQDMLVLLAMDRNGNAVNPPRIQRANVKNTLNPNSRFLMQPVKQASQQTERYQQDIYIGAKGVDNGHTIVVELWGAIARDLWHERSKVTMRHVPTRELLLAELPKSMDDLARQLAPHTPENCLVLRRHHRDTEKVPLPPCPYAAC